MKHVRIEWPSKSEAEYEFRAWRILACAEAFNTAAMLVVGVLTPDEAPVWFVCFLLAVLGVSLCALMGAIRETREARRWVRFLS